MKVLIAGGGTGGHLFPGIALAQELQRRDPAGRIVFCCTARDGAYARLHDLGFGVAVLPGSSRGSAPRRMVGLGFAAVRALGMMLRSRPDVVVGLGGYGSLAPVSCAALLRIPSLLLEQNVVPGRSNRWLSRFATEMACQWPETASHLRRKDKARVTGNPVRTMVRRRPREEAAGALGLDPATPTLLVAGGSQGATPLNGLVVEAMPRFAGSAVPVQFIHLTGQADCERVRAAYAAHGLPAAVMAFLEDRSLDYSACDLALSRAGGTSIAELTALGIPSLLVPLPHAADNHQYLNAKALADAGGARVLEQKATSPGQLASEALGLLADPDALGRMAARSASVGVPDAASIVADRVEQIARPRTAGAPALAADVRTSG